MSNSEIRNCEPAVTSVVKNILWLQVAVNHPLQMCGLNAIEYLTE